MNQPNNQDTTQQACCTHTRVEYRKVAHDGGTVSDSWICKDCGSKFWPEAWNTRAQPDLEELKQENARLKELYNQLLYAVGEKHKGETRHQTALRYIHQAEVPPILASAALNNKDPKP